MMTTITRTRFWRVEWIHRNGYRAPHSFVEAKNKKEAVKIAQDNSRFTDFPKTWSFNLVRLVEKGEEE